MIGLVFLSLPPKHSDQLDSPSRGSNQRSNYSTTFEDEALKNQTKAVLLAELVSMELFYGLEDLLREGTAGVGQAFSSDKLYGLTDRDLLLHSAETLLEVCYPLQPFPRPNSDLSQTSHGNIKGLSVRQVMRIENTITQVKFY